MKTFVRIMIFVCMAQMAGVMTAHAMKISDYLAKRGTPKERSSIDIYLQGYVQGLFSANDVLEARNQARLFCMKEEEQEQFVTRGNFTEFVDIILEKSVTFVKDDASIETALTITLANTYPCKKSTLPKK